MSWQGVVPPRRKSELLQNSDLKKGAVAALAYATVALLLMGDVLGREFFGEGIFGAPKMAVYAAIVAGFLGLGIFFREKFSKNLSDSLVGIHIRCKSAPWLLPWHPGNSLR